MNDSTDMWQNMALLVIALWQLTHLFGHWLRERNAR